ncbi:hypothetical protein JRO89_XS06G0018800 [Xanthoceras sorbifolium]|uniref:La-related protein 6A n=1 Tax=Xanthoceras sorbifolium TaxID=99658 RepID=A0ABQ8HW58_9ROSI|nr:hypothetical protein JRO89_XS06G0018800 [Xanthoceras sorbifolium]
MWLPMDSGSVHFSEAATILNLRQAPILSPDILYWHDDKLDQYSIKSRVFMCHHKLESFFGRSATIGCLLSATLLAKMFQSRAPRNVPVEFHRVKNVALVHRPYVVVRWLAPNQGCYKGDESKSSPLSCRGRGFGYLVRGRDGSGDGIQPFVVESDSTSVVAILEVVLKRPEERISEEEQSRRRNAGREGFAVLKDFSTHFLPPVFFFLLFPQMGGAEAPASTTTTTTSSPAGDSSPPSPPYDPDFSPVGSPEHDVADVQGPPSDDDHELDLDLDHEDQCKDGHSPPVAVLTDDLKRQIIKQAIFSLFMYPNSRSLDLRPYLLIGAYLLKIFLMVLQVEYYFSDENLPTDKHMMNLIKKNRQGFVPISVIASFRKMKKLTRDYASIAVALRESSLLVVSSNGKKVRRLNPLPVTEVRDRKLFTVLVENLPEDHSVESIRRIFAEAGHIKSICIRDPHAVEELKKGNRAEILISNKLHALVEYETVEAAEKAVATLNDEQDWRNGMRVKLLKRMGKYGHKMQAWRGSESEKNIIGHTSEQIGDEENNNLSEHHEDTPDEEEGDHLSKEKNGQKGRNRGRVRRNSRYRGTNGLGHGTTSSTHVLESKPPPGPRMPDGTRGFTMGRGRTPVAGQS